MHRQIKRFQAASVKFSKQKKLQSKEKGILKICKICSKLVTKKPS